MEKNILVFQKRTSSSPGRRRSPAPGQEDLPLPLHGEGHVRKNMYPKSAVWAANRIPMARYGLISYLVRAGFYNSSRGPVIISATRAEYREFVDILVDVLSILVFSCRCSVDVGRFLSMCCRCWSMFVDVERCSATFEDFRGC